MLKLFARLEEALLDIPALEKVRTIGQINELQGFDKYVATYQLAGDAQYKQRKGKYETPIFINLYSNLDSGDMATLWLREQVKDQLDEVDLSNEEIKTYMVKYEGGNPQPEKNSFLEAWQCVAKFKIRWEEL